MQRRTFLAGSLTGLSAGVLIPGHASATTGTPTPGNPSVAAVDEEFLAFLTKANEAQIPLVLSSYQNAA